MNCCMRKFCGRAKVKILLSVNNKQLIVCCCGFARKLLSVAIEIGRKLFEVKQYDVDVG